MILYSNFYLDGLSVYKTATKKCIMILSEQGGEGGKMEESQECTQTQISLFLLRFIGGKNSEKGGKNCSQQNVL